MGVFFLGPTVERAGQARQVAPIGKLKAGQKGYPMTKDLSLEKKSQ
jgi:hypothetical protein